MIIKDKTFIKFISEKEIAEQVKSMAGRINADYKGKRPLFVAVLNGSFMFASDLLKEITIDCEISFIKLASYQEMESSDSVKQLIGLKENIFKRDVIIIEDIIDTGRTIAKVQNEFEALGARSVEIVILLKKQNFRLKVLETKYLGFTIPDKFVVGYGLDYDGCGRNSKDIFQLED